MIIKFRIVLFALLFTNCFAVFAKELTTLPKAISEKAGYVNVIVDPRIELIAVVQQLSRYPETIPVLMNTNEFEYRKKMLEHFSAYKDHEAIKMFNEVSLKPGMYNFMAPPTSMLYLTSDFKLRSDVAEDNFLINRIGGRKNFVKFIGLLKDFGEKASFADFFHNNTDFYKTVIADVTSKLGNPDYVNEIEKFYGKKNKSYNIVLVPLYNYVGFGPCLTYKDGQRDIFNIMGPKDPKTLNFGDRNYFTEMQRHEFSHSFVNPLTEKYWDKLEKYSYLFDSGIYDTAKKKGVCGEWQECINEHIIRAVTTHLAYLENDEIDKKAYEREKSQGVIYLDEMLAKIKEYESQRDRYPDFEAFYPEMIKLFMAKSVDEPN